MSPHLTRGAARADHYGMELRALARPLVLAVLCAALAPAPASAFRRLLEYQDRIVKPAFAVVVGVGTYNPAGGGSGSLQLSTALRYLRPDHDDETYHSLGFEIGVNTWSASSANILGTYAEAIYFWPRTDAFTFDHHFFAGAGVGNSQVDRGAAGTLNLQTGIFEGGLQGRVRDWFLELRLKYIGGPSGGAFDVNGFAPSLSAAYHFDI